MRFTRLFSAITLVAAVTVLGSCGQSSTPTSTSATDPSLALGPREFGLSPNPVSWSKLPADPIPTDTRTVLISGVIAIASYPSFGTPVYTGTTPAANWLEMTLSPNFSMNPLGWKVTFKLKPLAQSLPIGTYTATIPVTVPAAIPATRNIVVMFSNCGNCIQLGDSRPGELSLASPQWNRSSTYNESGSYYYQDWHLLIQPGQTVWVQMIGGLYSTCNETGALGDLSDPHLSMFTLPGLVYVDDDDDSCGYSSQLGPFTNGGATTIDYLVRANQHASGSTGGLGLGGYNYIGTYVVRVISIPFGGYDDLSANRGTTTAPRKIN